VISSILGNKNAATRVLFPECPCITRQIADHPTCQSKTLGPVVLPVAAEKLDLFYKLRRGLLAKGQKRHVTNIST